MYAGGRRNSSGPRKISTLALASAPPLIQGRSAENMKNKIPRCILTVVTLVSLYGCVGVSMHSFYPTSVLVKSAETEAPLSGVVVKVMYDYDSYGVFWLLAVSNG